MSHHRDIKPGAVWREKKTSREVTVLNEPSIYGNDFVHVQGQRRSTIRRIGFLSRFELVRPADDGPSLLRRAANVMREMHRQDVTREAETFVAVAAWLDHDAEAWEQYEKQGQGLPFARRERSLAVARAYLGEAS